MVVVESKGLRGAMGALIIAEFLALLILVLKLSSRVALAWRYAYVKKIVGFSAPLAISSLLFIVFANLDRVVLSRYVSLGDLGVYGVGFIVGNITALVVTANNSSYSPRLLKVMKAEGDEAARSISVYFMKDTLALIGLIVGCLTVFSDLLVLFLGGKATSLNASLVVLGIASGHLARSQYLFYWHSLFSKNRTGLILLLNFLLLGIGFGVAHFLAWKGGVKAVAFMSLVSHIAIIPLAFYLAKQRFYIPIHIQSALKILLFVFFLLIAELYLDNAGRVFLSIEFWTVKLVEIAVIAVLYWNYCVSFCRKIIS